ncbi:NADPH-dependent FMN reductase [Undibacterium terreum]|uniref:NAD(P)H-dependent FMN reductase n=1 Tax=Undibacterium terreum TaxID=1224302 RepID=A0A916V052_9BURK|nr:NADPH-dependent FMN reductase [Undibacterium terreum]GGC97540.1 NAD(P)H-dependent FMN reductase [Undibacterium terreum]
MNILLLSGSPSNPSRSTRLLHHVGDRLNELGYRTARVQARDLPAQALLHADFNNDELRAAKALVAQADAVVVSTPVYKAAYSGVLKTFLDILPQDGLSGKLVLPLATGGSQSHMLALDYALRPVLASLAAKHILPSIYATDAQIEWSEEYGLNIDTTIAQRITEGISHLTHSLIALRNQGNNFDAVQFTQLRCSA